MGERHLVSTKTTATECARCHAPILIALDDGLTATVDHQPLDPAAVLTALLNGTDTYLSKSGELIFRDARVIRSPHMTGPIHAAHKCVPAPTQLTIDMGIAA